MVATVGPPGISEGTLCTFSAKSAISESPYAFVESLVGGVSPAGPVEPVYQPLNVRRPALGSIQSVPIGIGEAFCLTSHVSPPPVIAPESTPGQLAVFPT